MLTGPEDAGLSSRDYNFIGDGNQTTIFNEFGDVTSVNDPALGPLTDNGGLTLTHLPQLGSPALDGGAFTCSAVDQRNFLRPVDLSPFDGAPGCDAGAVEAQTNEGSDSDTDGMTNYYELANNLDPNNDDANDDRDNDGLSNLDEFNGGTAALDPDTEGDGLGDAIDRYPLANSNACIEDGLGDAEFNITARSGETTQCAAENSIVVRATAIFENGSVLELYSPRVLFDPGTSVDLGATTQATIGDPTPP